jgi:hypothetical protein
MPKDGFLKLLHAYIYLSAQYYRLESIRVPAVPIDDVDITAEIVDRARYRLWLVHDQFSTPEQRDIWAGANNVAVWRKSDA